MFLINNILPSAFCLLLSAFRLPPSAFCSLPPALLFSALFSPFSAL